MHIQTVSNGLLRGLFGLYERVTSIFVANARPTRNWIERDGVVYLTLTSDGTTGPQWLAWFDGNGFKIEKCTRSVLLSPDFKPTSGVTTRIAILKGELFPERFRVTKVIRAAAYLGRFGKPNAEITCLIRRSFSNKEIEAMGLEQVMVMHEPIRDFKDIPSLLCVNSDGNESWLFVCHDGFGNRWEPKTEFAFSILEMNPFISN